MMFACFTGMKRQPGMQEQRTRCWRGSFYEILHNHESGAVLALLKKSGGQSELGGRAGWVDGQRPLEEKLRFIEAAAAKHGFRNMKEKRGILR